VSGTARLRLIAEMTVTNVETGKSLRLGEAGELYSAEWLAAMGEPRNGFPIDCTNPLRTTPSHTKPLRA
jgi:hypothetical protein